MAVTRAVTARPATFFEHQAQARKKSGVLVFLFLLAVAAVTLAVNLVAAIVWLTVIGRGIAPYAFDSAGNLLLATSRVPLNVYVAVTLGTVGVITVRSIFAVYDLRSGGGDAVARMAGGVLVDRGTSDPDERRLLNVVDEMAIASGVTVPHVYILSGERAINAFAAGYTPNQAAIAVTEGALRQLTRDELQGVIGHEFSHVLNGDMRLNITMIGVLAGILFIGELGAFLMRSDDDSSSRRDSTRSGVTLLGLALLVIGYVGLAFGRLIKAAVSRQRELLGDASSVQFTRNPEGIAGALTVIDAVGSGSLVQSRYAETLSHMFFAQGVEVWFDSVFATHPPVPERIQAIDSRFVASDYLARRAKRLEAATPEFAHVETAAAFTTPRAPIKPPLAAAAVASPMVPAAPPAGAVIASVGRPTPEHVEHATKLLQALPSVVRDAANGAETAPALVLAFALASEDLARKGQLALLERAGRVDLARQADVFAGHVRTLPGGFRLPVTSLALASLRTLDQPARDALVRDLQTLVDADQRETLEEFVLLTVVRQHLRPMAWRAEPVKYRSILEVEEAARLVLSLLADAGATTPDAARGAFERGLAKLGLRASTPPPIAEIAFPKVGESLDRLRQLAPFVKRAFLEGGIETVMADRRVTLAESELLRAIATTLDCPVPPILDALDPATLA